MIKVLSWMIVLCGLWEFGDILALFTPGFGTIPAFLWDHIVVGIILMIVGAWAALTRNVGVAKRMNWIAAIGGIWLISASFILGNPVIYPGLWNDVIVGLVVVIFGTWAALSAPRIPG